MERGRISRRSKEERLPYKIRDRAEEGDQKLYLHTAQEQNFRTRYICPQTHVFITSLVKYRCTWEVKEQLGHDNLHQKR